MKDLRDLKDLTIDFVAGIAAPGGPGAAGAAENPARRFLGDSSPARQREGTAKPPGVPKLNVGLAINGGRGEAQRLPGFGVGAGVGWGAGWGLGLLGRTDEAGQSSSDEEEGETPPQALGGGARSGGMALR